VEKQMPKFANTAGTRTAPKIAGTGVGFLTPASLVGELIIVTPIEIVHGTFNEGKPDARATTRLKADVVVLTGPHRGNHPSFLLNGSPIVTKAEEILEATADGDGSDDDGAVIAGRLTRKPLKAYKTNWATPEALEIAISDPNIVVPNNAYSWLVPNPSGPDLEKVLAYFAEGGIQVEVTDVESDPFGD
jgi:hypothetical protein